MRLNQLALFITLVFSSTILSAQDGQTIRGQVVDTDAEIPLIGATIELISVSPITGTATDLDGNFELSNVPLGRQVLRVSYLGYESMTLPNILVTKGKEVQLNFQLQESLTQLEEVVVVAKTEKDDPINELATVSSKTFSMEEVNRYSGGRSDVSRLVSNFAGVATSNDSRNDIVIRGNSPTGVLWRLEGIPIPNPNHFATLGTTGGPVSALNPNLLRNSDFITSAFPSEYGDALSGVFDVGFRSGNKRKFEFMGQMGSFSGLEAMIEGPIGKNKNSSFLISFRNSFVALVDRLGIDIGTNATPNYRDLSFKFDLDAKKLGRFSIFGIGATSDIDFLASEIDENDLFANDGENSSAESLVGVIGLRHNKVIGNNAYIRTTLSGSRNQTQFDIEKLDPGGLVEIYDSVRVNDIVDNLSLTSFYNWKQSAKWTMRVGATLKQSFLDSKSDVRLGSFNDQTNLKDFVSVRNAEDNLLLIQPFFQNKFRLTEKLTFNIGLHGQFLPDNNSSIIEPRTALDYKLNDKTKLTAGYGLHSQTIPLPIYLYKSPQSDGTYVEGNRNLDFSKAHHFVLGLENKFVKDWKVKVEAYYQSLFDIPVHIQSSSFSLLNAGADFVFPRVDDLTNEGTGRNYGIEMTLEKFFSKGYYGLLTTSLFQSKYTGSDGIERNTAFNNKYVFNALGGKEFQLGKKGLNSLSLDFKITTAGGRFYTPVDLAASMSNGLEVLDIDNAFSERYEPYFRLDFKIGIRINSKKRKLSQQFFIDLQNVTNRENIFANRYNVVTTR